MKQSRHWAAWMAAWLIFLGLAILPREGAAWARYTDPIEPVLFGDPDVPYASAQISPVKKQWALSISVGHLTIVYLPQTHSLLIQPRLQEAGPTAVRPGRSK